MSGTFFAVLCHSAIQVRKAKKVPDSFYLPDGRPETRLPACAARLCHPGRFTLYPCHYNTAFACSLIPSTLSYRLALRSASPRCVGGQRRYFVHLLNRRVRVVPIGRQRVIRDRRTLKPLFLAAYLLVQACQHLMRPCWLVEHHGLYQHLLWVDPSPNCWAPTAL